MPIGPPRFRETVTKLSPNVKPGTLLGKLTRFSNGNVLSVQNFTATGSNVSHRIQRCWDNTNVPDNNRNSRGSRTYRSGGGLTIVDVDVNGNILFGPIVASNFGAPSITWGNRREYRGHFGIPILDESHASLYQGAGGLSIVDNDLIPEITSGMESAAWNIRPRLERASAATMFFELRELPSLIRQTGRSLKELWSTLTGNPGGNTMGPRWASDAFLAEEFGWQPFLGDVHKLLDAVIFSKQYIDQLIAQNNTWIKRFKTLEEESGSTLVGSFPGYGLSPTGSAIFQLCKTGADGSVGRRELWHDLKRRVWAVGEFKFYRPELDPIDPGFYSEVQAAKRHLLLYGARINPSHIYQVIPWTWLIDWFTNLGDIVSRVDEAYNDGMVSKYLYVMQSKSLTVRSLHTIDFWSGSQTFEFSRVVSTKQRRHADSPYGFVLGGSLTPRQWTILGALGLSRNVSFTKTL